MELVGPTAGLRSWLRAISRAAAIGALAIGVVGLVGWLLDLDALKSIHPDWGSIKANTALLLAASGGALLLLGLRGVSRGAIWGRVLALFVLAVALGTISQDVLGTNFGLDQLLFRESEAPVATGRPGRMSPVAAIAFVFLSLGLLVLETGRAGQRLAQILAVGVMAVALLTLLGYLFDIEPLRDPTPFTATSLPTAMGLMFAALSLLLARPGRGLMRRLTEPGVSSALMRVLLPTAVLTPILLGYLRIVGERHDLYDSATGTALMVLAILGILAGLIWWYGGHLAAAEHELAQHQRELARLNETLEQRVAERTALAEQRAEQLQVLASELTQAEHRERRRIAAVLHDNQQQLLAAVKLKLSIVGGQDEQLRQAIDDAQQYISEAINISRSLAVELNPPVLEQEGLGAALESLAREFAEKHSLDVDVNLQPLDDHERMDTHVRAFLYQAARELLFNITKHAGTDRAELHLTWPDDGRVQVQVTDQGQGCSEEQLDAMGPGSSGFGLFSVRQRLYLIGGEFHIDSKPNGGCRVTLVAPRQLVQDQQAALVDSGMFMEIGE